MSRSERFISSPENNKWKLWMKLTKDPQFCRAVRKIIVAPGPYGKEILENPSLEVFSEIITPDMKPRREAIHFILSPKLYEKLDILKTRNPIYVVRQPEIQQIEALDPEKPVLFIPFSDPGNMGAIIRSAVAFEIDQIALIAGSCYPFSPVVQKSSALSVFQVRFFQAPPLSKLQGEFIAFDLKGRNIFEIPQIKNPRFLVGHETRGLSEIGPKTKVDFFSIPIGNKVESLNAAVAASIGIFTWKNR